MQVLPLPLIFVFSATPSSSRKEKLSDLSPAWSAGSCPTGFPISLIGLFLSRRPSPLKAYLPNVLPPLVFPPLPEAVLYVEVILYPPQAAFYVKSRSGP